jgi:N6-L-threonylcarbamoyladenine synthase
VRREVERLRAEGALDEAVICHLCASFQQAAIEPLIHHTLDAARALGVGVVTVVGGVAANSALQQQMRTACHEAGLTLFIPPPRYCTGQRGDDRACGLLPPHGWAARRLRLGRLR